MSGLKSVISDSCGFQGAGKESPPGGLGVLWEVRLGKRAESKGGAQGRGRNHQRKNKEV